jgi:lincosamide nucleotidyltransferase A/C/D/E
MLLADVLAVTGALQTAGIRCWIGGGWGVDALVGRITREHRDLDLAVDADQLDPALDRLATLGYRAETDWLPVRLELAAPGARWVDLHPVVFDASGDGRQEGLAGTSFAYPAADLVTGSLAGRPVPCLSAARQRAFHTGYPPRPQDRHDLALLAGLPAGPEPVHAEPVAPVAD